MIALGTRRVCGLVLAVGAAAAASIVPLSGSSARAQAVGGTVLPQIALSIGTPGAWRAAGGGDYTLRVPVQVTSSVDQVSLSVADGDDAAGAAHVKTWNGPVSLAPATIVVRQRLANPPRATTPLHKLILITVSSEAP